MHAHTNTITITYVRTLDHDTSSSSMVSVHCPINVTTLIANESLHNARALGAAHGLGGLPGDAGDVEAAAVAHRLHHLGVVRFEGGLEAGLLHRVLPLVELLQNPNYGEAVAGHDHCLALAEHGPAALVLVGEELLDL